MEQCHKILVLPPEIANKIAAGEVVERPASVVKELVENALDAGASEMTIIIKTGGKELIQVVDNGMGMSADDLKMAFQRHATSKIRTVDDLHAIETLGFRGEALASIASVSRVEARSIERGQISGFHLKMEGGQITEENPVGGTAGTSIAVKALFFNTPARRKFLRADSTEYRHCLLTANRFALCYPQKKFTLVHNGEVIWEVHSQNHQDRICEILGRRLKDMLIRVEDDAGAIQMEGFVGNQDTVRRHSGEQYLFLNGRFIQDRSLHHAIISAYGEILAHGGYPLYVLHLTIDPTRVDVNVHPSKMEVKFADDRLIYSLLRGAVKRALVSAKVVPDLHQAGSSLQQQSTGDWLRKAWRMNQTAEFGKPGQSDKAEKNVIHPSDLYSPLQDQQRNPQLRLNVASGRDDQIENRFGLAEDLQPEQTGEAPTIEQANVWQMHNRYILTQIHSGLVIIDQHVAHERILYEKALKMFAKNQPSSQKVLFPRMFEVSAEDYHIVKEILPFLDKLGFIIKEFGRNTVVIEGIPAGMKVKNHATILQEMIDDYKRGKRSNLEIRDNVAKTFACHTAIRSGDRLTVQEMNALISQLFATETPYFCPHGRPVLVNISLEELDKRFGRI